MPKTLLLTGAYGMVGRNILEHQAIERYRVLAPSRRELDLADQAAVYAYVSDQQPDIIIHAAGRVGGIQANIANPVEFLVENLDIGRNLILAARAAGVEKVLNLASSCMYPRTASNPLSEDMIMAGPLESTNEGYALAKIMVTRLCEYVTRETPSLRYKTLIPCNLYGRFDNFDPLNSHLIPAIIHKLHCAKMNDVKRVDIWGDGSVRREFMYAGDVADAILKAVDDIDVLPMTMNIGLGLDYSVKDYYEVAAEIVGWNGEFRYDLSKPTGMRQKLVDIGRQERWGWTPHTSLRKGLELTYLHYLEDRG